MLGGHEAYDAVVTIEKGVHPLAFESGTHAAVVRVFRGIASSHVMGLEVCLDDSFSFDVHRPLTARRARPLLRGHVVTEDGAKVHVGARARDEHERSFDLLAGIGREMTVIGSLRLGQRVLLENEVARGRDAWHFGLVKAAA